MMRSEASLRALVPYGVAVSPSPRRVNGRDKTGLQFLIFSRSTTPRRARAAPGTNEGLGIGRGHRSNPLTATNPIPSFFFNDTATTEIYTLSLHDALPIS